MTRPFRSATLVLLVSLAWPAQAQHVTLNRLPSGEKVTIQRSGSGRDMTEIYSPFENTFGTNFEVLDRLTDVALDLHPDDRFAWWKKPLPGGFTDNSCAAAASHLHDAVTSPGVLPDGWEIRQVGTLGSLTNAENALVNDYGDLLQWYGSGTFRESVEFDALNPPVYAHSLTMVRSPTGEFYTLDTWGDNVEMKRVYPTDPDEVYFSENPNPSSLNDSSYKLSGLDDRGRAWRTSPVSDRFRPPHPALKSEPPPVSDVAQTEVLESADPNDKTGLQGAGEAHFVRPDERLRYVIRFENLAAATAPAQEVLVRDTLDARVLDLSTVELGDIRFGSRRVPVAPGRADFFERVPLGTDGRLELLVDAHLVPETGIVTWRFTTLATATAGLPDDPLDGFLPPNRTSPEGEGSVSLSVRARPDLPSGTVISNEARIVFDLNEPIDTPPWGNTLDSALPTSRVTALASTQADSIFTVSWSGQDADAGVTHYDVYASVNGGPFYSWLRRVPTTEDVFVGEPDSSYAFYSIATDAAGNTEPAKTQGEASTGVVVAGEAASSLPAVLTLAAPFPNPVPASGALSLTFGLPSPGVADVRVFDVRGRELASLASGDRAAGWHTVRWDLRGVASGVYVVRVLADGEARTRTVTVVR